LANERHTNVAAAIVSRNALTVALLRDLFELFGECRDLRCSIDGVGDVHGFERVGVAVGEFRADDVAGPEVSLLVTDPAVGERSVAHHRWQRL
jgi:hypothetical protein